MAALTSPPFVALFACSWISVLGQGTLELKVTVNAGDNAALPCRGHRGADIEVIKWIRPDLESDDGYVFFFREGRPIEYSQHPSFRGRVELRDPEMKDGDASVILKNVNINDAGTYECRVKEEKERGQLKPITIINMTVTEPGHTAGHKGGDEEGGDKEGGRLRVSSSVCVILLLLCVVGLVILYIRATKKEQPPSNAAEMQNLHREQSRDNN